MNVKKICEKIVRGLRRHRKYFPLVVLLILASKVIFFLDPKNPKRFVNTLDPKNPKDLELVNLSPVEFNSITKPLGGPAPKSPYLSDEGKHELLKQIANGFSLAGKVKPSQKFFLFTENHLLPNKVEFSFARALRVSRLVRNAIGSGYAYKDKWSVLSIGCRDAVEIVFLKRYFQSLPGLQVTGLDISIADDDIVRGDMHDMPFADNMFDIIISSHALEHCLEPTLVATEMKRVAKQNAIIGIEVPVFNANGTYPIRIEDSHADNWDYCNPTVLCGLFGEGIKPIDQEIISAGAMLVVIKAP